MIDQGRAVDHEQVNRLVDKLHGFAERHSGHATQKEMALALASAASDVLVAMPCPCCREAVAAYVTRMMQSAVAHAAEEEGGRAQQHLH